MEKTPRVHDVLIVGSGPAGVAAAWPLVEAGHDVLMVDGGQVPDQSIPRGDYESIRRDDPNQWQWMIGREFEALRNAGAVSPKFRAPTLAYVFREFVEANQIAARGFVPIGSLAVGGLSNAWGCGVARFSPAEMSAFPFDESELGPSYARVCRRIGISGAGSDDLTAYFGVDAWADPPVALDDAHRELVHRYARKRVALTAAGFALGRARVAVLSQDREERKACSRSGFCLWGCAEGSLYSAQQDLRRLRGYSNFTHRPGFVVDRLDVRAGQVAGASTRAGDAVDATCVVLAAGTLATTRIAMRSLPSYRRAPLLALPFAAFALWLPGRLGAGIASGPAFAQLAFALDADTRDAICGFTFSTHGLPVSEFVRSVGWTKRSAARLFPHLLSSVVVANCFFPAHLSANSVALDDDGVLRVEGADAPGLPTLRTETARRLRRAFRRLGAHMLPGSFRPGSTGADAHYAGTLPMRAKPVIGETDCDGALAGLPGVHVADAAAFPSLPAKSHTLAMMACADRLGTRLAARLRGNRA